MKLVVVVLFLASLCSCLPQDQPIKNLDIRSYMSGKNIYQKSCAQCHGESGEGYKQLYPSIVKDSVFIGNPAHLACLIHFGSAPQQQKEENHIYMPASPELNSDHLTDVVNYIIEEWGTNKQFYTKEDIKQQLNRCL